MTDSEMTDVEFLKSIIEQYTRTEDLLDLLFYENLTYYGHRLTQVEKVRILIMMDSIFPDYSLKPRPSRNVLDKSLAPSK